MAISHLERPQIRPRHEPDLRSISGSDADEQYSEQSGHTEQDSASDESATSVISEEERSAEEDNAAFEDISFGALAKAQESVGHTHRKRKRLQSEDETETSTNGAKVGSKVNAPPDEKPQQQDLSRSSKHAPAIQSSRNPVTRRRTIFSPPPATKFRDPRFDATIVADTSRHNPASATSSTRNYSFLTEYQAAEVLDLKSSLKKTKDANQQAELKRQIMSLEAKVRNAENQRREADILRQHKQQEKAAIREGKKSQPYYLKKSALKEQMQKERLENMGKRARDKSDMRKRKRQKHKEAKDMPRARRTFNDGS